MRNVVVYLIALLLSLWLGGLVALVVFVSSLFTFQRSVGVEAAPQLFHVFERYQIVLAAGSLILLQVWSSLRSARLKTVARVATLLAAVLAVVQIGWITPTINASREIDRATFDQFHHLASINYSTITLLVAFAGGLCIAAARREWLTHAAFDTASATAAA